MLRVTLRKESGDLLKDDKWLGRLNNSEYGVITCLYENKDKIVSHDELLTAGWPSKIVAPNSLNVAIKNIRTHLGKAHFEGVIETHVKKGFSWHSEYVLDIVDVIESEQVEAKVFSAPQNLISTTVPELQLTPEICEPPTVAVGVTSGVPKKDILHLLIIVALIMLVVSIGVFYKTHWTSLTCYNISKATFCGVGDFRVDMVEKNIHEGDYLFGYSAPKGEFFYVKI